MHKHKQLLDDSIARLDEVNEKLAQLKKEKEELELDIIMALGHDKEGQKTYRYEQWDITCKTPVNYTLDKKAYINGDIYIDEIFDPVIKTVAYELNKSLYKSYMETAPLQTREALQKLVKTSHGKPSVSLKWSA